MNAFIEIKEMKKINISLINLLNVIVYDYHLICFSLRPVILFLILFCRIISFRSSFRWVRLCFTRMRSALLLLSDRYGLPDVARPVFQPQSNPQALNSRIHWSDSAVPNPQWVHPPWTPHKPRAISFVAATVASPHWIPRSQSYFWT